MGLYRSLLRPLLFRADAEKVHGIAIRAAELAGSMPRLCSVFAARLAPRSDRLATQIGGLQLHTPLGLAAGFDKSARAVPFLAALGFGHVEVGSISADPSAGNPRPRLFRIPEDRGIVVHYGLPNDGADAVAQRLAGVRPGVPLCIKSGIDKPLFLKVAPFAAAGDVESFLQAVEPARFVTGFSVNLPSGKPEGLVTPQAQVARMPGAVSGRPAAAAADRTIGELYRRMDRARYRIIGSGGVFTGDDAYRKIRLGASLVQLLTALVYEGPAVVASINRRLAQRLEADGFAHVADAVGVDALESRRGPRDSVSLPARPLRTSA
jgi:dihydroorotate dehydrogenase